MATTLTVIVVPGYLPPDGEPITPAQFRQMATPVVALQGTISEQSIADGSVTPAKLAASVAGDGLAGGAGTALSVKVDGITLQLDGGVVKIKGAITLDMLSIDAFLGASAFMAGERGLVTAPKAGEQGKYLRGDGAWADPISAAVALTRAAEIEVLRAVNLS